ncbi:MAG: AMP-binding protein [Myxococcota bacterium]
MSTQSYGRAIAWLADQDPDRVAIRCGGDTCTRRELDLRGNRLARAYAELGVTEGSLVTVGLPNSIEFYEACLAVWRLGATPNPVSNRLPAAERIAIIETADPSLVVGVPASEAGGRPSVPEGWEPSSELSDEPLPDVVSKCVRAMTSGGSTGRPKVIVDTVPAEVDPERAENGITPGGCTLVPGPLYHAGPFMTSWSSLTVGASVVVMQRFDAEEALALIEEHRADWVLFVPTMMQRIWRLPESVRTRYDVSSLGRVMCTGAPSPAWLKRAWIDWLGGDKIFEAYGGTERIAGTMISGTDWLAHPGSVGKPTLGRKMRILDDAGNECGPGEVGEVYMMPPGGQGSTYRYLGADPRSTGDGWETLGDLGYLDEDGFLYLVDRKTDMIVTGGANVYPAEIEGAIDGHPAVRSSAVVGLPDDDLGQRVHAIVDAPAGVTEAELRAELADRLVRYKIPRTFEFVDEPLRDDAGKVRRSALREARIASPPQDPAAS